MPDWWTVDKNLHMQAYTTSYNMIVMILKEFPRVPDFFILTKHSYYFDGSQTQVSVVINSELHWF